jgi:phage I-like protein
MTIQYAALAFDLSNGADKAVRLLPMGGFASNDGRPAPNMQWTLNDGGAARIVNYWNTVPEQMVIDYEHQTQKAEFNGLPAPAAGWAIKLEARSDGVYARIDWTAEAAGFIKNKQYRYISPVFSYDGNTGEVLMLHMAALTNSPGLTGLTELNPAMLSRLTHLHDQSNPTNQTNQPNQQIGLHVKKELLALLALAATSTDADVVNKVATLQADYKTAQEHLNTANAQVATLTSSVEATGTELVTLKAAGANTNVAAMAALQTQVATLQTQLTHNEVAGLVAQGLSDGRILESTKVWATELGKQDVAQLKSFLAAAPVITALTGQQSHGTQGATDANGLSADELAVCQSMGIAAEDFAKAKTA